MNRNNLFWCDICNVNTIDNEGLEGVDFFSCYSSQSWIKHLKTPKHIKQQELTKSLSGDEGKVCGECSKKFTAEGYAIHKKRNKPLWDCYKTTEIKKMTCNNFCIGKKRYESIEAYKKSLNKPIQRRTPVGKFSPITQTIRPPNGYGKEKPKPKELITCSSCKGALFTSQYDTKFLELHNTFVCKCEDDIKVKQETKIEKDDENNGYIEEKDKYKLLDSMKEDFCLKIKNKDALNDDEVDITEKPIFDDICDMCSLGINYGQYPIKIINKWEIDTCACLSTEDESE
tara:strand:- start:26 stop:883 length:858 start_codon:yes stop_codon:yes gene_type:complete